MLFFVLFVSFVVKFLFFHHLFPAVTEGHKGLCIRRQGFDELSDGEVYIFKTCCQVCMLG